MRPIFRTAEPVALAVAGWLLVWQPAGTQHEGPLSQLAQWAASRLGAGYSYEHRRLWGGLSYVTIRTDSGSVGLAYESAPTGGCRSCPKTAFRIAVLGDRVAAIDFLLAGDSTATASDSASAVRAREAIERRFLTELIAHGVADSLARAAGLPIRHFSERLADVLFLLQTQQALHESTDEE